MTPSSASAATYTPPSLCQRIDLNTGWRFHLGDVSGAQATAFNDSSWGSVNVLQFAGGNYHQLGGWADNLHAAAARGILVQGQLGEYPDVVFITSRRWWSRTTATTATTDVKVYSNAGTVTATLNGTSLGARTSTDRIFTWTGVTLRPGTNTVTVTATINGTPVTDTVTRTLS